MKNIIRFVKDRYKIVLPIIGAIIILAVVILGREKQYTTQVSDKAVIKNLEDKEIAETNLGGTKLKLPKYWGGSGNNKDKFYENLYLPKKATAHKTYANGRIVLEKLEIGDTKFIDQKQKDQACRYDENVKLWIYDDWHRVEQQDECDSIHDDEIAGHRVVYSTLSKNGYLFRVAMFRKDSSIIMLSHLSNPSKDSDSQKELAKLYFRDVEAVVSRL